MDGWISLHRKIRKNWVWQDAEYFKMWIDLLLKANHADNKILMNKQLIEVKRGDFITSLSKMAKENKCSIKRVRRFLMMLESDSMVVLKTTRNWTQISICNYDTYQNLGHTEETQKKHRGHTEGTLRKTNNNDNNDNNDNNKIMSEQSSEVLLSKLLYDLMLINNPNAKKPNFQSWAIHIDRMKRIDKRTEKEIEGAIRWSQQDSFWSMNVLSTQTLRKQYDKIYLAAKKEKTNGEPRPSNGESKETKFRKISEFIYNDPDLK